MSATLICDDSGVQLPVFYVSHALVLVETRYLDIEKLTLTLLMSSRKLHSYFQAHIIVVMKSYPFYQVLCKPDASGRLMKWFVKLEKFEIRYQPRTMIKVKFVVDFIVEFIVVDCEPVNNLANKINRALPAWSL